MSQVVADMNGRARFLLVPCTKKKSEPGTKLMALECPLSFTDASKKATLNATDLKPGLKMEVINQYFEDSNDKLERNIKNPHFVDYSGTNAGSLAEISRNVRERQRELNENFTLVFRGFFVPPESGHYQFQLQSDDSAYVWMNTRSEDEFTDMPVIMPFFEAIIKNPGIHSDEKKIQADGIYLEANRHYPFGILYGQGLYAAKLKLSWSGPGRWGEGWQTDFTNRWFHRRIPSVNY